MEDYLRTSKYIPVEKEQTVEERYERFVNLIGIALEKYQSEEYNAEILYTIVHVACQHVDELFPAQIYDTEDYIITSKYIPFDDIPELSQDEAYDLFAKKIQRSYESYQRQTIGKPTLYYGVKGACECLEQALESKEHTKKYEPSMKK